MKRWIILFIVLLSSILRLYQLGDVPVGLHRDEAFLGFNAFSILTTGKDMTGNTFPTHLESFLYSPAGYAYAAIPAIALFGLTPFAVRLPAALAGIFTVIAVYFLANKLFTSKKYESIIPTAASFLLAISPWHINLTRTATENSIVVLCLTLATLLYIVYIQNKHILLFILSLLCFAGTYMVYQAPRAFLPLFIPIMMLYGWQYIPTHDRLRVGILTFVFIFIPLTYIMTSPTLSVRIRTVSIFSSEETQLTVDESIREDGVARVNPLISRLFHNKVAAYAQAIAKNYFRHFSYDFLLTDSGYPDRYRVPGAGPMYPWELASVIVGGFVLALQNRKLFFLLLGWIVVAPLGSALTSDDVPNVQRTLLIYPALTLVTAIGLAWGYDQLRKTRWVFPIFAIMVLWVLSSFASYLHAYYIQQVYHRPWYRHEGYAQLVKEVNRLLPRYSKAVITNHESSPTIFFLFYTQADPRLIQQVWQKNKLADLNTLPFSQYEFSKEPCPVRLDTSDPTVKVPPLIGKPNILYVNFSECKVQDKRVKELSTISRSDGSIVFRILEVTP